MLVVKYEALKENTVHEVQRMLSFLGIEYDEEQPGTRFDAFHRKHNQKEFDHFTIPQRLYINEGVREIGNLLASINKSQMLDVHQYISNVSSSWHV